MSDMVVMPGMARQVVLVTLTRDNSAPAQTCKCTPAVHGGTLHLVDPLHGAAFCGAECSPLMRPSRFMSHGCTTCARLAADRDFLIAVEDHHTYVSLPRFLQQRAGEE